MKASWRSVLVSGLVFLPTAPGMAELLAYYSFDSDFTDGSGNDNHLTIASGTPVISTSPGEVAIGAGALDLNSAVSNQHYLNLGTPISFAAGDAWSVSFWARHRVGNDGRTGMIAGDLTSNDFIWVPRDGAVDGLRFRNNTGQNADYTSPHAGVEPGGVYHHWAVIADGLGSIEVFYDNVSLGTRSISTSLDITSIGQAYSQTTQSMNGQIDELYIYDEAIDAVKVAELFGEPVGPDTTPPTLSPAEITDNKSGGPVDANSAVIYTISFSEDMDDSTVDSSDFGNAGTSSISIGTIVESSPGVFSIPVTPTSIGTLRLQVNADAVLNDPAGNPLDTSAAIVDDETITVEAGLDPSSIVQIKVFLLAGQSNAAGRGSTSDLPAELQTPQDEIDFYNGSLTTLRPGASQFGPEITWGKCLSEALANDSTRVAIIKYGVGGTDLENDWQAGGDSSTIGDGPQYQTFQNIVTSGLSAIGTSYPNALITIEGILWVQGERDAKGGFENSYAANLTNFIADVRATYGADLPFIISRLSINQTNIPAAPLGIVRAAQDSVAAADQFAALLDTDSYGMQSDNLHFNALGQQEIGQGACLLSLDLLPFPSQPDLAVSAGNNFDFSLSQPFPGFRYTLYANPGLAPGDWVEVDSQIATGSVINFSATPPVNANSQFYRIGRTLP